MSRHIKSVGAIGSSVIAIVITRRHGPSEIDRSAFGAPNGHARTCTASGEQYDCTSTQIVDPAWSSMSRGILSVSPVCPSILLDGPASPLDSCPGMSFVIADPLTSPQLPLPPQMPASCCCGPSNDMSKPVTLSWHRSRIDLHGKQGLFPKNLGWRLNIQCSHH
ncbi:hypothetical protein Tco_1209637 [Tanacetum coccineum]